MGKDFEELVGKKEIETDHNEFYDDIIEKLGGLNAVKSCVPFSLAKLKEAYETDKHFNNTRMKEWDTASGFIAPNAQGYSHVKPIPSELRYKLAAAGVTCYANSQGVCLLKRIAERMVLKSNNRKAKNTGGTHA